MMPSKLRNDPQKYSGKKKNVKREKGKREKRKEGKTLINIKDRRLRCHPRSPRKSIKQDPRQ
jgi:hypothetical protein